MAENWDGFSTNIGEVSGRIARKPYVFNYSRFEVWQDGICKMSGSSNNRIEAKLVGNDLHVTVEDDKVNSCIKKKFVFGQISTTNDRTLWSKDIFNETGVTEKFNPDLSSLFYKNGQLAKVTFTIHDPDLLVEFYQ